MRLQRLLVFEAGGFALALIVIAVMLRPSMAGEAGRCADLREQVQAHAVDVSMAALVPRERETLVFSWNFRHERRPFEDSTRLSWEGGAPFYEVGPAPGPGPSGSGPDELAAPQAVRVGDILGLRMTPPRTSDNSAEIPASSIGYYAVAIEDGVSVKVCVEAHEASPGVYTSAIRFDDPDLSAAPIGVELTVKENDVRRPVGAALLGLFAGFLLVTLKWHEAGAPRPTALGVGLVVGVIGVVPPAYSLWSDNPTWGGDGFLDMFGLFTSTALGIFGSAAVAEALSPATPPPGAAGPPEGDEGKDVQEGEQS